MANLVLVILHFKMYKNFFESFEDNCVNKCVDKLSSDSAVLCAYLNKLEVWKPYVKLTQQLLSANSKFQCRPCVELLEASIIEVCYTS